MKSYFMLTSPEVEPVTLEEIKAFARIEHSSDNDLLTSLLVAARQWCEAYTRRVFIEQTWAVFLSEVPRCNRVQLPKAPLLTVSEIVSFNEADEQTVFDEDNYYVNVASLPGEVVLRSGASWPSNIREVNGIKISYTAGYGSDADSVPCDIKLAIKQLALHWYENRGEAVESASYARAPLTIEGLLQPYRLLSVRSSCV